MQAAGRLPYENELNECVIELFYIFIFYR